MATIRSTVHWQLTIEIGGEPIATVPPTWAGVQQLAAIETRMADRSALAGMEDELRAAVKLFCPPSAHGRIDAAGYVELLDAVVGASAYFDAWLKKKQQAARAAALGAAAGPTPPSA